MTQKIICKESRQFINKLHKNFNDEIIHLLNERQRKKNFRPAFKYDTKDIREGTWEVAKIPDEILDRRVEITGPPDRKMIINALNSGANVYMCDFEDSNCPMYENVIQGQINLHDAVKGTIEYTNPKNGKKYSLGDKTSVLFVRPRGLHLLEKNYFVDRKPIRASLFDYGLYVFHNYKNLLKKGSRPYFYLPKLESHLEARLWANVFKFTEQELGMEEGTIRATVLIETLPAAFQMHEILYELKNYSAGLNCGRWDYIFSFIKKHQNEPRAIMPDRDSVGMTQHFMRSYSLSLIQTCHQRGAHAIGGMAAQIPIKNDPEANDEAMRKVVADKLREVTDGHDGTWVAHPGLVPVAKEVFDKHMPEANQINKEVHLNNKINANDLLCVPKGFCTEEGLRKNISVCFKYLNAWINGNGCVPINNAMEDAATAEISRAQIWQWLRYSVKLSNGKKVTEKLFTEIANEELDKFKGRERYAKTKEIFMTLCTSPELIDFLTPMCYNAIH
jgi:malate synthase